MKRISIEKTEDNQSEEKKEKKQRIRSGLKAGCGNPEGMISEIKWISGRPILKMS